MITNTIQFLKLDRFASSLNLSAQGIVLFSLALLVTLAPGSFAADTPFTFQSEETEASYQKLLAELRCLVCQNQSLADSHADLAQDLRNEVYKMLQEGKSDDEIRQFMVARYGDFVLYKPPIKPTTLLLWFGPFLLVACAAVAIWLTVKRQQLAPQDLDAEQTQLVKRLREASHSQITHEKQK